MCNPPTCLFRHKMYFPVHVRLEWFHWFLSVLSLIWQHIFDSGKIHHIGLVKLIYHIKVVLNSLSHIFSLSYLFWVSMQISGLHGLLSFSCSLGRDKDIQIGYSVKLLESYCIKRFTNNVAIYERTAIVSFIFSRNYMLILRFIHFYICNQFSLKKVNTIKFSGWQTLHPYGLLIWIQSIVLKEIEISEYLRFSLVCNLRDNISYFFSMKVSIKCQMTVNSATVTYTWHTSCPLLSF